MTSRHLVNGSGHWSVTHSQWAVGAGFFHSQEFATRVGGQWQPFFRVVYDCGSSRKRAVVEREVDTFVARHGRSHDLLFISHFDKDHVSGLSLMRDRQIQFRRTVAPLLDPEERLLAYAKSLATPSNSDAPDDSADIDEFYRRLIAAPTTVLRELGQEVELVAPGDGADENDFDPVQSAVTPVDEDLVLWEDVQPSACTVHLSGSAGVSATRVALWEFKYYVLQRVRRQTPHFREHLRSALGLTKTEFAQCLADEASLLALVTDFQRELRALYDALAVMPSQVVQPGDGCGFPDC